MTLLTGAFLPSAVPVSFDFLTIVGGLLTPTSGDVIINGENLSILSEKQRSKIRLNEIGFIL